MLVLMRRVGESIVIDGGIRVTVVSVQGERVRIGIEAPPDVRVDRQEVHERRFDTELSTDSRPCLV
jgi:carbon storage regulator